MPGDEWREAVRTMFQEALAANPPANPLADPGSPIAEMVFPSVEKGPTEELTDKRESRARRDAVLRTALGDDNPLVQALQGQQQITEAGANLKRNLSNKIPGVKKARDTQAKAKEKLTGGAKRLGKQPKKAVKNLLSNVTGGKPGPPIQEPVAPPYTPANPLAAMQPLPPGGGVFAPLPQIGGETAPPPVAPPTALQNPIGSLADKFGGGGGIGGLLKLLL